MIKFIIPVIIIILNFILINNNYSQLADSLISMNSKFDVRKLYFLAIQEDVKTILTTLDTVPDSDLSADDAVIKAKFYKRFVTNDEEFDYNTKDPLLTGLIDIYKDYWKSILLKEKSVDNSDAVLKDNLFFFVKTNYTIQSGAWDEFEAKLNPWLYLSRILKTSNYFNNVDGKTGNLYDIYIWKVEDTVDFSVQLPEEDITVPVVFMKDIITMGWEEYATFGKAYPGGWPKDSVLYCVAKAYDTTKETFLVSYLAHEAQHFSDMKKYKDLSSWQLEYRAKLAELSKANETVFNIVKSFIAGSKNDSTLSHPYAEYLVISNMSRILFGEDFVSDIERWKSVSIGSINIAASGSLKQNSTALIKRN